MQDGGSVYSEDAKVIATEIKRLSDCVIKLQEESVELKVEMAVMKAENKLTKGIKKGKQVGWGAVGGAPSLLAILWYIIKEMKG